MTATVVLRAPRRSAIWLGVLLASRRAEALPEVEPAVLERARTGDPHAFAQLIRHYDARLRALAYRLLNDRDLTDDVLQEAYVRAFKSLDRFRGDASLGTWLYRITYNACMDQLRRNPGRRGGKVVPLFPEEGREPADVRADPEGTAIERGDLAAALASLPPDLRAAVLLVDADGLDYAEAGQVLGIPAGTVGSRLNKARAILRVALGATE
jgi:RNA polymerase sigma-70 factor (ECF subfamily)